MLDPARGDGRSPADLASVGRRWLPRPLPVPPSVRECGDELVALAGDGRDEARMAVIVLELDAQAPNVAIDDVALGHEVGAPHRVEDLFSRDDLAAAAGQQV